MTHGYATQARCFHVKYTHRYILYTHTTMRYRCEILILGQNPPKQYPPGQNPPDKTPRSQNPPGQNPPKQNPPNKNPSGQIPPGKTPLPKPPHQNPPPPKHPYCYVWYSLLNISCTVSVNLYSIAVHVFYFRMYTAGNVCQC